jgi:hypothetical protein
MGSEPIFQFSLTHEIDPILYGLLTVADALWRQTGKLGVTTELFERKTTCVGGVDERAATSRTDAAHRPEALQVSVA